MASTVVGALEKPHVRASRAGHATTPAALSPLEGFVIGAVAACGAVTLTNPPELVKTRLQLLGEAGPATPPHALQLYRSGNPAKILVTLFRAEGLRGIQSGLSAGYAYQILLNGSRLGLFDPVRLQCLALGLSSYLSSLVSGALCGAFGAAVASPLFLVKTRMQSFSPAYPVGMQHEYVRSGLVRTFTHVWRNEGPKAIFKGVEVGVMRTAVGSAVQLSTYTALKPVLAKAGLEETSWSNNLSASLITGFFVAAAMNPFDVIWNRVLNAPPGTYRTSLDCLSRTLRNEGPWALAKGYTAHFFRIGPHGVVTLVLMDQLRAGYSAWKAA